MLAKSKNVRPKTTGPKMAGPKIAQPKTSGPKTGLLGTVALLPIYHYGAITFGDDQFVIFPNLPITFDGNSSFSMGGWIRLLSEGDDMELLSLIEETEGVADPISLGISGTNLYATISGGSYGPGGSLQIGQWQYVMVTFATNGNHGGTLTFYIDGAQTGQFPLTNLQPQPSGNAHFALGAGAYLQCMDFSIWSVCLTQAQCLPDQAVMTPTAGLEICCDFSVSPAQDRSGHNYQITYSEDVMVDIIYPGLALDGSNFVQPNLTDGVNPGGGGTDTFSVSAWIYPTTPVTTFDDQTPMVVFANGYFVGPTGIVIYLQYNASQNTFQAIAQRGGATGSVISTGAFAPAQWHQIAVTYDGTTFSLYLDGQLSSSTPSGAIPPLSQPMLMIGAAADNMAPNGTDHFFSGYIQALSIWNTCLSGSDVVTYMSTEPSEAPGCVAYYSLSFDQPVNAVSGQSIACYRNAVVTELDIQSAPGETVFSPRSHPSSLTAPAQTLRDAASASQFDLTVRPVSKLISSAEIDRIMASFERYLFALAPPDQHDSLRQVFTQNLYHGIYLQEAAQGPTPGAVTFARVGEEIVFHYHTVEGPQECGRVSGAVLTPCQSWIISVVATAVGCLLSVFGVGYTTTKLTQKFLPSLIINFANRMAVFQRILAEPVEATTVIRIVSALGGMTSITSVIASALSGISWWSWAFTLASLSVQIASLWLTGGLFLVYILAQLGLGIAQLVYVINQKPSGCNAPPELTGLSPVSATSGGGGFSLNVAGNGFLQGASVNWNGSNRQTTFGSEAQLTAQITAADISQPGNAQVTVVNPSSNNTPSNALTFYIGS